MKKTINLIICFVTLATISMVSCTKPEEEDNVVTGEINASMIVGTWRVDNMTVDGQDMTPQNMLFIMNEGGSGLANDNGETENNDFTWSINGNQLTITPRSGVHYVYTITKLTEDECTFNGTNVPMADVPGSVIVHLVRVR